MYEVLQLHASVSNTSVFELPEIKKRKKNHTKIKHFTVTYYIWVGFEAVIHILEHGIFCILFFKSPFLAAPNPFCSFYLHSGTINWKNGASNYYFFLYPVKSLYLVVKMKLNFNLIYNTYCTIWNKLVHCVTTRLNWGLQWHVRNAFCSISKNVLFSDGSVKTDFGFSVWGT